MICGSVGGGGVTLLAMWGIMQRNEGFVRPKLAGVLLRAAKQPSYYTHPRLKIFIVVVGEGGPGNDPV